MILTTICYLKKDEKILLLHRNKKENDIHTGKWIGIGGKLEIGEDPEECIIREVFEESGYKINSIILKGYVTFPSILYGEDQGMFIFTSNDFTGELIENCNEGDLKWINEEEIKNLPSWPSDYYFYDWIKEDKFTTAKIVYKKNKLVSFKYQQY